MWFLLGSTLSFGGADVLIIYDTKSTDLASLKTGLEREGLTVEYSDTDETSYDGTNPSPWDYGAVIHLNGTTYSYDMPQAGQEELVDYVSKGGGFISTEWNAYEYLYGRMQYMEDLILLERTSGTEGSITYTVAKGKAKHPVLDGLSSSFSVTGGSNIGYARSFKSQPSEVLATHSSGGDAVVVREFGSGHVVSFAHAGNYNSYGTLAETNVIAMYLNAVLWVSSCDIDEDGFLSDRTSCGGTDCVDTDSTINTAADEYCDGVDNDCDKDIDEDAVDAGVWYADYDGDGFGDPNVPVEACGQPSDTVEDTSDCDDADPDANPLGTEVPYDGIDQNCDGEDLCDVDFDSDIAEECGGTDCNDGDYSIYSGAKEIWYDGIDQDCSGGSDYDQDGDGEDSVDYSGTDCDDTDASIYAGAEEVPDDGIDQDCNGEDAVTPEAEDTGSKSDDGGSLCSAVSAGGSLGMAVLAGLIGWRRRR